MNRPDRADEAPSGIIRPSLVFICGAGGHAKVVTDVVRRAGYRVAGLVDLNPAKLGLQAEPGGGIVIAEQRQFMEYLRTSEFGTDPVRVALGIGDNRPRWQLFCSLSDYALDAVLHPSATIGPGVTIGRGSVLMARAIVNAEVRVGDAVVLNTGSIVEHDCEVRDGAHIAPGAVLTGGVRIGERALVGAGATVLPGRSIGADAVVGAGAVVVHDVSPGITVAGNPARLLEGARS